MVEGTAWLNNGLLTSFQDQNQERGHVYTKRIKTNPRSAVLKNITDKADQGVNLLDKNYNYPI